MKIEKYTFGTGDRFAHQGKAQLAATVEANQKGIPVFPVWNKSFREHSIVGSQPQDLRDEADQAIRDLNWQGAYYVDADHIGLKTVDAFLAGSNFYTLDVADYVGEASTDEAKGKFLQYVQPYLGNLEIPGLEAPIQLSEEFVKQTADKFLRAIGEAKAIYQYIAEKKGSDGFITEVSVDETDTPQSPSELFLILAMIAMEGIPAQTIAPKFTGRFNKGVDYVGDLAQFEKEFNEDLYVIAFAIEKFGLPETLKLSVHSGSDKFSIYPIINRLIKKHDVGLHVKTAGTTWLEEVIGLAEAGGEGLDIAKAIYRGSIEHFDELTAPYATVIDIDPNQLPAPEVVDGWTSEQFTAALRHDLEHPDYNQNLRQLIHVGFKIAAKMGATYTDALKAYEKEVSRNVTFNLLERHILPIFG